jgi:hypothetical protein
VTKRKPIRFTTLELGVLVAAIGNVDPAMFEPGNTDYPEDEALAALDSGADKLREMLARRER